VNDFGKGQAYYIASRNDEKFTDAFLDRLVARLHLTRNLPADLPEGVTAQLRGDGQNNYIFVMNFNPAPVEINLGKSTFTNLLNGQTVSGMLSLASFGVEILQA
jgi:beta-galactosidase